MMLREYQRSAVAAILLEWRKVRSTLFVCPTGGGKSRVFCAVAERRRRAGRALIIADRRELVKQAAGNVATYTGLSVGIEMADERVNRRRLPDVVCASVQSLRERLADFAPGAFATIVVDEADLAAADSYRDILARFPKAKILGVTATPDRADGRPLGDVFETVAHVVEIADLIRAGHLSRIRQAAMRIESVNLDVVPTGDGGDLDVEALARVLSEERPLHEVVKPTLAETGSRPTIVFACNIAHAEALAAMFNRYRPGCARAIHSEMDLDRDELLTDFAAGRFQFLVNVGILTRGVDIPPTACVVMARPTESRALYAQCLGRGTRPSPETGKVDLLVLDFAGNAGKHSLVTVVDILGGKRSEETRERARERMEERPGADVLDEIDRAEEEVVADPAIRKRVRAKVRTRMQLVDALGTVQSGFWRRGNKWWTRVDGKQMSTGKNDLVDAHFWRSARGRDPTSWDAMPLGLVPDRIIAERRGCSVVAVYYQREKRGIRPCVATGRPRANRS